MSHRQAKWGAIGTFILTIILIGLGIWAADWKCRLTWPAEFLPQLTMGVGCTVVVDGHRVPESAVRIGGAN